MTSVKRYLRSRQGRQKADGRPASLQSAAVDVAELLPAGVASGLMSSYLSTMRAQVVDQAMVLASQDLPTP